MVHEAFIYGADDEYVEVLAPFLAEAARNGGAAIAVARPERIALLRSALGPEQASVSFFDADDWYRRPGATLAAWRAQLDARPGQEPLRVVGEVTFAGDPAAVARWMRYESLLNRAFAQRSAWVICPYDARRLPEEVVESARRTHPVVSSAAGRAPSPEHFGAAELGAALAPGLPRPHAHLGAPVGLGDQLELRRAVTWPARAAGLPEDVVEDLLLAIGELARGASATLRAGRAGGEWFCEVAVSGPHAVDEHGLGIVVARLLCDRVEVEHGVDSTLVRLVFGSPNASPRERILAAYNELFAEQGAGAGINAISSRAGVAKGTLYAHFGSKSALVATWRDSPPMRWFEGVRAELEARTPAPAERLVLLFDVLGEWLAADEPHARRIVSTTLGEQLGELEDYLRSTASAARIADAEGLAAQLVVLVAGALTMSASPASGDPLGSARRAAAGLVPAGR